MEKVVFKSDYFVDFAGERRQVVFCAVSTESNVYVTNSDDPWLDTQDPEKELWIGVSVQNPRDLENEELGKIVAEGKARKLKSRYATIYASNKGLINYRMVNALLEQELEYFKQNPGKYIKGYDKDKELFNVDRRAYDIKFSLI